MLLRVFGKTKLESSNFDIEGKSSYMALLAICYLSIEGRTDRQSLANIIQAADTGKKSQTFNNKSERVEKYTKARRNFRQNLYSLNNLAEKQLVYEDQEGYLNVISEIKCEYNQLVELFEGNSTDQLDAITLFERQGEFLEDFENLYPDKHKKVATELKFWVQNKKDELNRVYLKATHNHNSKIHTFEDLEKRLPKDAGPEVYVISADTLTELYNIDYDSKQKWLYLEYIENYIPIHIAHVVDENSIKELTFKILEVICLIEIPDLSLIQNTYSITDDILLGVIDELQAIGWLVYDDSTQSIQQLIGRNLVLNRLKRHYSQYLNIVNLLYSKASLTQRKQLLHFLINNYPINENDCEKITRWVIQICKQLNHEELYDDAITLSESLKNNFTTNKIVYIPELDFWLAQSLERAKRYEDANNVLKQLLKTIDNEDEEDLNDMAIALRALVLTKIGKSERDANKAEKYAQTALKGSSNWAKAEANYALGIIAQKANKEVAVVMRYFDRSSLLWESLGESLKQLGVLSTIAATFEHHYGQVEKAEEAYLEVVNLAKKYEIESSLWIGILQNQTMFYHDSIQKESTTKIEYFTKQAKKGIKELERVLGSKTDKVNPYVAALAHQNIATFYYDNGDQSKECRRYRKRPAVTAESGQS